MDAPFSRIPRGVFSVQLGGASTPSMRYESGASNTINGSTAAMLPIVYSLSRGARFQHSVRLATGSFELLMTLGQSLVGALLLINMELGGGSFGAVPRVGRSICSFGVAPGPGILGASPKHIHPGRAFAYFAWARSRSYACS